MNTPCSGVPGVWVLFCLFCCVVVLLWVLWVLSFVWCCCVWVLVDCFLSLRESDSESKYSAAMSPSLSVFDFSLQGQAWGHPG